MGTEARTGFTPTPEQQAEAEARAAAFSELDSREPGLPDDAVTDGDVALMRAGRRPEGDDVLREPAANPDDDLVADDDDEHFAADDPAHDAKFDDEQRRMTPDEAEDELEAMLAADTPPAPKMETVQRDAPRDRLNAERAEKGLPPLKRFAVML